MLEPARIDGTDIDRCAQTTAWFAVVAAVAETTEPEMGSKLREGLLEGSRPEVGKTENLETRAVDQKGFPVEAIKA